MIADDDPVVQEYLAEGLHSFGFKNTVIAENGLEATALIHEYAIHKNNPIELIILDLTMPHMTGYEFIKFNINRGLLFQTPIILHSSDQPFFPIFDHAKRHANIVDFLSKNKMSTYDLAFSVQKALTVLAPNRQVYQYLKLMRHDLMAEINAFNKGKPIKGQLELFGQPIYDLSNMKLSGHELLLRWRYQNQIIPPNQIVNLCKEYGLLKYLSIHIFRLATLIVNESKYGKEFYTLNIDPDDLEEADFVVFLLRMITEHPLLKEKLILEITEETLIKNLEILRELKNAGFQLYLDDFGSGHANLEKLFLLIEEGLICKVKVDSVFISYLEKSLSGQIFYEDIIRMLKNLSMDFVMEGIETAEVLEKLKKIVFPSNVNVYGQGYYLGRPEAIPV